MRTWARHHAQAFRAALPRIGALNALVIGLAVALPVAGYAVLGSLRALTGGVQLQPQLTLFLATEAKRPDAEALAARLRGDARLSGVRLIPREEALKDLAAVQGIPELVAALGRNPLPDAIVAVPRSGPLGELAAELRKLPGVAHVQADADWARRLATLERLGRLVLVLLAALIAAGLVGVTFNTVRLQVLTRRDEIEVAQLLGATDAFIGRPFYYAGLLQGIAGGLIGLALAALGLALLNREVMTLAEAYGSAFRFRFPGIAEAACIVFAAGVLGWFGALLSLRRHLARTA